MLDVGCCWTLIIDVGHGTLVVVVGSCCCLTLVVVGQWLLLLDMVISRFFSVGLSIASAFGDVSSGAFHNFSLFLLYLCLKVWLRSGSEFVNTIESRRSKRKSPNTARIPTPPAKSMRRKRNRNRTMKETTPTSKAEARNRRPWKPKSKTRDCVCG